MLKGVSVKLEDTYQNDEEGDNWEKWSPDPVDADPGKYIYIYIKPDFCIFSSFKKNNLIGVFRIFSLFVTD